MKVSYHLVRLFDEVEQIMTLGDLDVQRSREMMKSIRRGDWPMEEVHKWAIEKEQDLKTTFA